MSTILETTEKLAVQVKETLTVLERLVGVTDSARKDGVIAAETRPPDIIHAAQRLGHVNTQAADVLELLDRVRAQFVGENEPVAIERSNRVSPREAH